MKASNSPKNNLHTKHNFAITKPINFEVVYKSSYQAIVPSFRASVRSILSSHDEKKNPLCIRYPGIDALSADINSHASLRSNSSVFRAHDD